MKLQPIRVMLRIGFLVGMFIGCGFFARAQNLVPNGDFEQYSVCPMGYSQLYNALFWMNPSNGPAPGTPDYFNQCSTTIYVSVPYNFAGNGFQYAHSGSAYAGVFLYVSITSNGREYIETPLTSPLIAGTNYHFQMYINLSNACVFTSDNIGVYFSSTAITGITNYYPLPFIPQIVNVAGNFPDSLNWTLVEGDYTAIGGEDYLIIGNYNYDSNTNIVLANNGGTDNGAYCFIDDVSLTVQSLLPIINLSSSDTTFCEKHCLDFFDLSTNNPTSWQWFFPGADSTSSTLQNPTNICYNQYGSFDVTLIACNVAGCDTLVLPGFINEYQTLTPTITQSNDTLFSSPGVAYQWWSVDIGIIAGANTSYYIPAQGGSYYVMVTDTNGCEGASNTIVIMGVNQLAIGNGQLAIVPNPNDGSFIVTLNTSVAKDFSISIIDHIGRTVFKKQEAIVNGQSPMVNLSNAAKGLYVVEVINDGKVYRARFIVE